VRRQLGETMAAVLLLAGTIKFEGSLILQAQGEGPLRTLVAQATHRRTVRGLALWNGQVPDKDGLADVFGEGRLVLTIDRTKGERHQGIVPLDGNRTPDAAIIELAWCLRDPSQQTLVGNTQSLMQALHHTEAQGTLAIQHLGHPTAGADIGLEIAWRKPLLLHSELDRIDRIGRTDRVMFILVGFDQSNQNFHFVGLRRAFLRLKDSLKTTKGRSQILVATDRPNIH
jgi:redox-regulated HSP33 family molecular chaperone